ALVHRLRAVLRRSLLEPQPRGPWPLLLCQASPEGLTLHASQDDLAVRFHREGSHPPAALAFRASVPAEIPGRGPAPVVLEAPAPGQGRARWGDGPEPHVVEFETVVPESVPALPPLPCRCTTLPEAFLPALAEAARTAPRDHGRTALTRVQ